MHKSAQQLNADLVARFTALDEDPNAEAEFWIATLNAVAERIGDWIPKCVDEGGDTAELEAIGEQLQDVTDLIKETCMTREIK